MICILFFLLNYSDWIFSTLKVQFYLSHSSDASKWSSICEIKSKTFKTPRHNVLTFNKKKELIVSKDFKSYEGEVVRVKEKFSFVHIEELDEDYYVKNEFMSNALIHDKVKIWLFFHKR